MLLLLHRVTFGLQRDLAASLILPSPLDCLIIFSFPKPEGRKEGRKEENLILGQFETESITSFKRRARGEIRRQPSASAHRLKKVLYMYQRKPKIVL